MSNSSGWQVFLWVALATSWCILSGYAGYFSFGHGAFFGAGMYTTATLAASLGVPFLLTLPAAGLVAALLATAIGGVVFRVKRLRGELFGLLTLAITFVLATIVLNTRIDGGPGVYLSAVPMPQLVASPTGTLYPRPSFLASPWETSAPKSAAPCGPWMRPSVPSSKHRW